MVPFFADDDGVDEGNFDHGRFCDSLGWGEGVYGPAGAFDALLEAFVRPFDAVGRLRFILLRLVLVAPRHRAEFCGSVWVQVEM